VNRVFDHLDRKIILELQKNGRISYKDIAKKLNISDGTIRFRVGKLMQKNILRITASINPFALQNGVAALVGMQLEKRTHQQTMEKILQIKGVSSVTNVTGSYDLMVEVFFESRQELRKFLVEGLSEIGGINRTETFVYLDGLNKWTELHQTCEP
jgi:Lrp/AsnC family transcriptional regulator for asnA, asnC and gidA